MNRILRNIGFFLLLLGASSFLLPLIGWNSRIMLLFGEHQKVAAIAFLVVGGILFGLSFRRKKEEEKK
jgi:hypothetical protein